LSIIEDAPALVRIVSHPCAPGTACWVCTAPAVVNLTFDKETLAGQSMNLCKRCHDDLQTTVGFISVEGGPDAPR
jgi:hypothetical protein